MKIISTAATVSDNQRWESNVVLSATGVFHRSYVGSSGTSCNSRNGGFQKRATKLEWAQNAKPEQFCKKCFSRGKPEQFYEHEIEA